MDMSEQPINSNRYAKCIEVSKRIRWDIDRDVIRGRQFDFSKKFLPDGLSMVARLPFLSDEDRRRTLRDVRRYTSLLVDFLSMFGRAGGQRPETSNPAPMAVPYPVRAFSRTA